MTEKDKLPGNSGSGSSRCSIGDLESPDSKAFCLREAANRAAAICGLDHVVPFRPITEAELCDWQTELFRRFQLERGGSGIREIGQDPTDSNNGIRDPTVNP